MKVIQMILLVMALNSCVEKKIIEYDMSSSGAVNSIKEIKGEAYILNSTNSSIIKLKDGKTELFRDLEIKGRDFLLDFDIDGETVYYSNTYDEIFISSGSVTEDTIKVQNPDRIALVGEKLFVTSRRSESGYFFIRRIDPVLKTLEKKIPLNDTVNNEAVFSRFTLYEHNSRLWLINPFRNTAECYDTDLNKAGSILLPASYKYGNFLVTDDELKIIASCGSEIFMISIQRKNGRNFVVPLNIKSENIDITSSCVTAEFTILYDYINSSVICLTNR